MCVSKPMSMSSPATKVDASTQPIKSNYALSDENKRRNAEMKRKQASLVNFNNDDDSSPATEGSYQVGTTGTFAKRTYV